MEAQGNKLEQRRHGLLRVLAVGLDPNTRSTLRRQRHHAEDALAVHDGAVFVHFDGRLELVRHFHELRPRSNVHAERIHDERVAFDHCHITPATRATAASMRESLSPLRRSPRSRSARKPSAATTASATRAHGSNGPDRYAAVCGSAAPTARPMRYGWALKKCAPRATAGWYFPSPRSRSSGSSATPTPTPSSRS